MQALLEMSDLESAEAMVRYYSERPPRLGSFTLVVQFSNYDELKTEPTAVVYIFIIESYNKYREEKYKMK